MSLIEIPDFNAVLVFVLYGKIDSQDEVVIPSPALAYSKWELRGLLGIPRDQIVELQTRPGEWLMLFSNDLYPFKFQKGMLFRAE